MFFLLSHILVGKYFPNFLTQLIIGCSFYIISLYIVRDILSKTNIDQLKYLALSAAIIDVTFIIFRRRKKFDSVPAELCDNFESNPNPNARDPFESTILSEINDFKVVHDFCDTDVVTDNSMFSTSDEKPVEEKPVEEKLEEKVKQIDDQVNEKVGEQVTVVVKNDNNDNSSIRIEK